MADFEVKIVKIDEVTKHSNADSLDIARIGGFNCITKLGEYKAGDLAVYIPEFAVIPEWLLKKLGFWDSEKNKGKLNGSKGNRVKIVRLRGSYSQGILIPVLKQEEQPCIENENGVDDVLDVFEGQEVSEFLGIVKYSPPIPVNMAGQVSNAGIGIFPKFDVENIQKHPDIIKDGDRVEFTGKIHGTCLKIMYIRDTSNIPEDVLFDDNFIMSSKGQSDKGLVFKNNELNKDNVYIRTVRNMGLLKKLKQITGDIERVCFLGEVFGKGVQDLTYGQDGTSFRLFDIATSREKTGNQSFSFLSTNIVKEVCKDDNIPQVPILYTGKFSEEVLKEYTDGIDTIGKKHIREGIVIRPVIEKIDDNIGRVILKSVSKKYLMRKNGTEFN